jgi:DHA1 family inner membrane transport protein
MRAWTVLAALMLSAFTYVTTETLPIGLLPQIAGDLGKSPSAVGLLVTAYGLVVVLSTIPLTRATGRWPRRRLLAVLLVVFVVANALSALAATYAVLLLARVVVAMSQAVFWAVVTPAAASLFRPAMRPRAVALLYVGSSSATLVGVPAGTWLGQLGGWRVPFVALSVLGVAVLVVLLALMPHQAVGESDADRGTAPDAGRYRVLVVVTAAMVTGAFTTFTYVTPFLTEVSGFGSAAIGPILLVRGLAGLTGAVLAGLFAGGRGWAALVIVTVGQAVALTAQFAFGTTGPATIVTVSAAAMALSGMVAVLGARVLEVAPGSTDMASAGTSTAFNVGITGGALFGSILLTTAGVRSSALAGAALTVVALAVLLSEPRLATSRRTLKASPDPLHRSSTSTRVGSDCR